MQSEIVDTSKFRFNRKSALLTYPNVTEDLSFSDFFEQLASINPVKNCVIGRELHPISGERHFHAFVEWQSAPDLKGSRGRDRLLVRGFGVHVSKHRKGAAGKKYSYEYCIKDQDFWEYIPRDPFPVSRNFVREHADLAAWT